MAAENRGLVEVLGRRGLASMRPRRMAAENSPPAFPRPPGSPCFNEAAAHGRGKRGR